MWTCQKCMQKFAHIYQAHACNEKTLDDFLAGKSEFVVSLFQEFINEYNKIASFELQASKSRIAFTIGDYRLGYMDRLGKDFINGALTLNRCYHASTCFYRISQILSTPYYQHHFRIYDKSDLNEELKKYMRLAYELTQENALL